MDCDTAHSVVLHVGHVSRRADRSRAKGVDITKEGSGNPGASNVSRVLGWQHGVVVFALDAAKGAISAALGLGLDSRATGYACIAAAAFGHMYPATRRFRGGKGVATVGGAMFVMHPLVACVLLATWFVASRLTGKASLASMLIIVLLPIGAGIDGSPGWEIVAIIALGIIVLGKHLSNIKRLINRQELSMSTDNHNNR